METIVQKVISHMGKNSGGFTLHYLFLYNLIIGMEAKNVLELGAGFSTPVILGALEKTGGKLITCDQRSVAETGNDPALKQQYPSWKFLQGKTGETLAQIQDEVFDVVLHDASHDVFPVYQDLRKIIPHVKQNGIILVHDTEHPAFRLRWAVRLAFLFTPHEKVTLPYGYGLTIVRILKDFGNGEVLLTWKKGS
ncbi:MAG: class I SAM-dependent methyltransferase [Candidatus Campbellbacteria bacterium]|nr:class I SAM-dependent methyltransferase [Candidatus Campbellbacteria bacterium]